MVVVGNGLLKEKMVDFFKETRVLGKPGDIKPHRIDGDGSTYVGS